MEYIQAFRNYLLALRPTPSTITVKNYSLDVKHFISWFENKYRKSFDPKAITQDDIVLFRHEKNAELSLRSLDRHVSSLRKFFHFLKLQGIVTYSPLEKKTLSAEALAQADPFYLKQFKDFLYVYNAASLTIKNYIIDVKQFFRWAQETFSQEPNLLDILSNDLLAQYRDHLVASGTFSTASINRKLSSLRKYIAWAKSQNLLENQSGLPVNPTEVANIPSTTTSEMPKEEHKALSVNIEDSGQARMTMYSSFPPFRLAQKISNGINFAFDAIFIAPFAHFALQGHRLVWKLRGKPLFTSQPWYQKVYFHARNTRPNWYKRYHSYALAHYFNWAILMIIMSIIGFGLYNTFIIKPQKSQPLLAATAPNRILSFQGRLTDSSNNPITTATNLRFGIYTDATSTGSALLWQEVDGVTPDANGVFSVLLGKNSSIQQSLFANNANLYLGIAVGATAELTPREQLATVAFATNAETLQGLPPITQSGAGTSNVVLALNSSGNLSIGAASTFQTVGGAFTLSGDTLVLNTNAGTNGNITVAPDGQGFIDLQKPLINSTQNNNISSAAGSVEIDDTLAVLATNSGIPAVTINQNGAGALFTASSGGVSEFTLGNSGTITSGHYQTAGGIFYADSTGLFAQTTTGTNGQCLTSTGGTAPTWGTCGGASTNYWTLANGALYPVNETLDAFIGGTATSSAKFSFLNVSSGTPTASVSSGLNGTATFITANGTLQTTNNQGLTLGGTTTGNITVFGLGTGVVHSTAGVLSSSAVSLTSDVSGILPLANGGTGANITGDQGGLVYFNSNTTLATLAHAATAGQCLISGGTGTPSWTSCSSAASNWWNVNSGALYPINDTFDLLLGGSGATTSAKFAVLNMTGSGTPTASVSSGLNGSGTFITATGTLQTTNNQGLTLGGTTTGSISFANNINSNIIPAITDTYNLGSASLEWNNIYVKNIVSTGSISGFWQRNLGVLSPTSIADDLAIGGVSTSAAKFQVFGNTGNATTAGTLTFTNGGSQIQTTSNQPLTLGGDSTGGITLKPNNGIAGSSVSVFGDILPDVTDTRNMGSSSLEWNAIFAKNIFTSGTYAGFFQRNLGVLSPTNITDDIAVGGTSTSSAKFQIFGNTGNATTAGTLTFTNLGSQIQTTNNQGLTIGGDSTGNITLKPLNGVGGTVTISGLGTGVVQTNSGVLSTGNVSLTTEVTGILPIANGGTNTNSIAANGAIAYSNGTQYAFSAVGSSGQCLVSNGSGAPSWTSCSSASSNWWNMNQGTLFPINQTLDLTLGSSDGSGSSASAKFAVLNMTGSGTPTASVSSGLNGSGTYITANGTLQTTNFQGLTIGGATTGNITLKASNGIAGSSVSVFADLLPDVTDTRNLGSSSLEWNNLYVKNIISSGNTSGFWQRNLGVLAPTNIADDLAIGGVSTAAAKFQVFGNTGNATTAGTLTFTGTGSQIQTVSNQILTLGGTTTGGITLKPNNGITGASVSVFADLLPDVTDTRNLGSSSLEWNNLYVKNIITSGNISGFWQRNAGTVEPLNITDDILAGGTATTTAKFAVLNMTGSGNPTASISSGLNGNGMYFDSTGTIQTVRNAGLTIGGTTTGNITLAPLNNAGTVTDTGNLTVNGTTLTIGNGSASTIQTTNANLTINAGSGNIQFFSGSNTLTSSGNLTLAGNIALPNSNTLTGISNAVQFTNGLTVNSSVVSAATHTNIDTLGNVLPGTDGGANLGSSGLRWNNLYANNVILPVTGGTDGYWTLASNVLSPTNIWNDLAIGGSATSTAKFQVFANTGNATTAGNLTFNGNGVIQTTNDQTLTFGGNTTGNISFGSNTASDFLPYKTDTYNLGSNSLEWNNLYVKNIISSGNLSGFWQRNLGALAPLNITDDILGGGTGTTSAKFAVLNMTGSGTPTASVSSGLNGAGTYITANGTLQTTNFQGLTIGGATTGNITLSPLNGNGTVTINGTSLLSSGTSFNLLTNATTITEGAGSGTTINLNAATIDSNQATLALFTTPTTVNIGANSGTTTVENDLSVIGNTTLGTNTTKTIAANGQFTTSLIPHADLTYDIGSSALRWNNLYAGNINLPVSGGTGGYWTLASSVLYPTNTWNDVAIGGNSTASAKFQVFANTGNATTAGNLTFNGNGVIQTTNDQTLTLGGTTTGNVSFGSDVASNFLPYKTNTYDLGALNLQWNNIYGNNIYSNGQLLTQLFQRNAGVLSPINIADDLAIGGVSTAAAKFQVFGLTGNATTEGTLIFNSGAAGTNLIASRDNQGLTIGDSQTGNILFNAGNVGIGTTNPAAPLEVAGTIYASSLTDRDNTAYFVDPANSGTAATFNGNIGIGTTNPANFKLQVAGNVGPDTTNNYDLGSGAIRWRNLYLSGNYGGFWQLFNGALSPFNITNDLLIGSTASVSARFHAYSAVNGGTNPAASASAQTATATLIINNDGVGEVLAASSSSIPVFSIRANGQIVANQYSTAGGVFYTNSTGVFQQASNASAHTVLHGGVTPTFGAVDLSSATSDVTGILPLTNGGTGANITGDQGGIVYFDSNTTLHALAHSSTVGQCLLSGGTGAPTWSSCSSASSNWWNMNNGELFPINSTLDLTLGSSDGSGSSASAKFAVLNMTGSGTPTASVSSGLNGAGTYITANGTLQTTNFQGLTIGGATTGNITLSPLNGNGTVTINGTSLLSSGTSFNLLTNATTITEGAGSGTTINLNAATIDSNQATLALFTTPSTVNEGASNKTFNVVGNFTAGALSADLIPTGNGSINLGSPSHYYGTVYADNFIAPVGGGTSGFWQLTNSVLSPVNFWNDLSVGGNATGSATPFQVFATTVGVDTAGTATSSGGLSFRGTNTNIDLLNGSILNFKTSVGGDAGLSTVLSLANNGNITQTGNYNQTGNFTTSGNVAINGGNITTTAGTAGIFESGATTINFGTTATTAINIGNDSASNLIRGSLAIGSSATNTLNIVGKFISSLIPNAANTYDLGTNSLAWRNLYLSGNYAGFWQRFSGAVSPYNITDDLLIGATATPSAATDTGFQVFGSGTNKATASTSGNLVFYGSAPTISTQKMLPLVLGSATTGPIQLSPKGTTGLYVDGTGNVGIATTNPTAVLDVAGAASVSGTLTFRTGLGTIQTTAQNTLTLGGNTTGNISFGSHISSDFIPFTTDTYNLGSAALEWNNLYVRQIITPSSGGIAGYWQLNNGVLSPANIWNDLAVGGTSTASATFHVYGQSQNQGTLAVASVSAHTSFAGLVTDNTIGDLFTASSSGQDRFVIKQNGNVGIGIDSPANTLQVAGDFQVGKDTAVWGVAGYSYRRQVSITNNSGTALTNYQVKLVVDTATLITAGKITSSSCNDIRFTDQDGSTNLNYWIENGCNTNYTTIWVNVPTIGFPNKTIYMYYGKSGAAAASSTTGTFVDTISNVQAAYRLDEPTYDPIVDYSTNGNVATASGTTVATGEFNKARTFNGTSDYIAASDSASLQQSTNFSASVWFKTTSTNLSCLLRKDTAAAGTRTLYSIFMSAGDGRIHGQWYNGTSFEALTNAAYNDGNWHYAVMSVSGGNVYLSVDNKAEKPTAISGSTTAPSGEFDLGACPPNQGAARSLFFNGSLDEARVYSASMSATQESEAYGTGGNVYGYVSTNNPNKEMLAAYTANPPTTYLNPEQSALQTIPSFYVQNTTGAVGLGTLSLASTSARLTVAGDIKSGLLDTTAWGTNFSSYSYRARVNVDNTKASTDLTNYIVKVTTNTSAPIANGKMRSDCGDIRFADADGNTSLSYWIETGTCNTASTVIDVKVPTIPGSASKNIYMYYGNPAVVTTSSTGLFTDATITGVKVAYRFDETSGSSITDYSGNSNTGTATGTVIQGGYANNARHLNGASDYVVTSSLGSVPANYTLVIWFKPESPNGVLIDQSDHNTPNTGYHASVLELVNGTLQGRFFGASYTSMGTPTLGTWNQAAIEYNGTNIIGFLNGAQKFSTSGAAISPPSTLFWLLGATDSTNAGSGAYFTGSIDEFRYYNTALSSTQISHLYGTAANLNYGYVTTNSAGNEYVRPFNNPEPVTTVDTEQDPSQVDPTLYVSNTFKMLGVNTANPTETLDVFGATPVTSTSYAEIARLAIPNASTGGFTRLLIGQNSSSAMFLDAADQSNNKVSLLIQPFGGNVGIGTTAPVAPLEVAGTIYASSFTDRDNTSYFIDPAAAGTAGTFNGNVGIGTTAPKNKLQVAGGRIFVGGDSTGADYGILGKDPGGNMFLDANISGAPIGFWTNNSGSDTEKMIILDSGNVGIGTTGPASALQIVNNNDNTLSITTNNNTQWFHSIEAINSGMASNTNNLLEVGQNASAKNTAYFAFNYTSSGSTSNYASIGLFGVDHILNVTGAGNVGIGTTSPGALLNVKSGTNADSTGQPSGTFASIIYNANNSSGANGLFIKNNWRASTSTILEAGSDFVGGAYASYFHVGGNGNVGINVASPIDALETHGTVISDSQLQANCGAVDNVSSTAFGIYSCGSGWTTGTWQSSDIRVKDNITSINPSDALSKVMQLRGVTFTFDNQKTPGFSNYTFPTGMQIGLIAQEVQKIVPEVAIGDPNGPQPMGVAYQNLVGLLIPAVQAQQEEIASNEASLNLTSTGDISITDATPSADFTIPSYYTLSDVLGNPISRMGAFVELVIGNLRAGSISTQQLFTNSLAIATDNVSIAGQKLSDYILAVVNNAINNGTLAINSPISSIDQIHTNLISPLASNSAIAIDLTGSKFTIRNNATGSAVASIDNNGNATFSGTLNSQNLAVNGDATVSGTLHAGKIVANDIEGLSVIVGTLSAQNITNVNNIYFATPSGIPTNGNIAMGQSYPSSTNSAVPASPSLGGPAPYLGYTNIASYSGFLAAIPNLSADTAIVNQNFVSLGSTALGDTTITGQLSVGTNLILADSSINVLGQSLEIQPLRQGGVNFEGGLLAIDTDGNLTVNGNAVFSKTLAANIISPISNDRNLNVQLGENSSATGSALATSNLSVQNASGSGIFSIDQLGNVIASGAASIAKLNLTAVQPALAVSDTEVIATGSAGTTLIKAHQTEVTIDNPLVTSKSLIYITPVGQSSVAPYLLRQVDKTSFTVGIPIQQVTDTTFNWLIVN